MFTIRIALDNVTAARFDRLMDYLEGVRNKQLQAELDAQVQILRQSTNELQTTVERNL